jgi:hypothetical protein
MMTATQRGPRAGDSGKPGGPGYSEARLLALRCLGIPQISTRTPIGWHRALRRLLAAYCARIRPRNTAELASVVLRMGDDIDMRERMLDAALRATGAARQTL